MTERWAYLPGETATINLDALSSFKLQTGGGTVTVLTHDAPTAHIAITAVRSLTLGIDLVGSALRMRHINRGVPLIDGLMARKDDAVELVLTVPREMRFEFGGLSCDIVVSGLSGSIDASTVGGKITLDGCSGDTKLNAVSGEISVLNQSGELEINTVSGNVTVSGQPESVAINSVTAGSRLNLTGRQEVLRLNQASGVIQLRLERQPLSYRINAKKGAVIDGTLHREARKTVEFTVPGPNPAPVEINSGLGEVTIIHVAD